MGKIHDSLNLGYLAENPSLRPIVEAFLHDFDVTWGAPRKQFGSEISAFFLKPETHMAEMFGFDREILLLYTGHRRFQPRTVQIAEVIFSVLPARGRLESLMLVLVSPAENLRKEVAKLLTDNAQSRIPIPFAEVECRRISDQFFVRQRFQEYLFSRDLFDFAQPISSDLYFFGRISLVIELRDAVKGGENIGLFGLRKMDKTSIIYKLQRVLKEEGLGTLIYLDLQDPDLYALRWWQLLGRIRDELPITQKEKVNEEVNENNAAGLLRSAVEMVGIAHRDRHIVIALDEIEHISPRLCMRSHWNNDFLDFWKALQAVQNENRHISLLVAGVNASVIETPSYHGYDNPLFSLVKIRYVPAFNRDEIKQMVQTLGHYMGLRFAENTYDYLREMYGGHPMLSRLVCSSIHKRLFQEMPRPVQVELKTLEDDQKARDRSLFTHGGHILSLLQEWYPQEYEMLEYLASGEVEFYTEMAEMVPQYEEHLNAYQLVQGNPPRLTIPFLGNYIKSYGATKQALTIKEDPNSNSAPDIGDWLEISALRNILEPYVST